MAQPINVPIRYGRYYLIHRIASGGMSEVFLAKIFGAEGFERALAVKRIPPDLNDKGELARLMIREAKLAAKLHHPNICHIYDLGRIDDTWFIAMEHIQGKTLRQVVSCAHKKRALIPVEITVAVMRRVLDALAYAHSYAEAGQPLNITHGDVSPQNIMVSYNGETRLIDFGIARANWTERPGGGPLAGGDCGAARGEAGRALPLSGAK